MTKKWLVDQLNQYPDEAEILIEIYSEKDNKIHCAEPTGIWLRSNGNIIISNDD